MVGYIIYQGEGLIYKEQYRPIDLEVVLVFPENYAEDYEFDADDFAVKITYFIVDDWNNLERGFMIKRSDLFKLVSKTKEWFSVAKEKNVRKNGFTKEIDSCRCYIYNIDQMGSDNNMNGYIDFFFRLFYNNEHFGLLTNGAEYDDDYVKLDSIAIEIPVVEEIKKCLDEKNMKVIFNNYLKQRLEEEEEYNKIDSLFE